MTNKQTNGFSFLIIYSCDRSWTWSWTLQITVKRLIEKCSYMLPQHFLTRGRSIFFFLSSQVHLVCLRLNELFCLDPCICNHKAKSIFQELLTELVFSGGLLFLALKRMCHILIHLVRFHQSYWDLCDMIQFCIINISWFDKLLRGIEGQIQNGNKGSKVGLYAGFRHIRHSESNQVDPHQIYEVQITSSQICSKVEQSKFANQSGSRAQITSPQAQMPNVYPKTCSLKFGRFNLFRVYHMSLKIKYTLPPQNISILIL